MGFTQIIFLLASAAIIGPIMAHMFHRAKFRRVAFTMIHFLQLTQKQTQSQRRLREFLILLLRCTIIVLIAMLFAGPVIKKTVSPGTFRVIHFLVLDDSVSMLCKEGGYDYWKQMQAAGKKYINSSDSGRSVFNVYTTTHGFLGKNMTAQTALHGLGQLEAGTGATKLSSLIAEINKTIQQKGRDDAVRIHLVSDFTPMFTQNLRQQSQQINVESITYDVIGKDVKPDNMAVTNAEVVHYSKGILTLTASVANYGKVASTKLVQARVWNQKSREYIIKLSPGTSTQQILEVAIADKIETGDFIPVEIHLTPDDSLDLDNVYRLAVAISPDQQKNILVVGETESELFLIKNALDSLYARQGNYIIQTSTFNDLSYSFNKKLDLFDTVIFSSVNSFLRDKSRVLNNFLEGGGRLIFFAGGKFDKAAAEELFRNGVLAACPERLEDKIAHSESLDHSTVPVHSSGIESELFSVVDQYKIDQLAIWSYYRCRYLSETSTFWQIAPQAKLLYINAVKNGKTCLINTSIDDSFSALTKSPAILPICQLLIGTEEQILTFSFPSDKNVVLPAFSGEMQDGEDIWLIDESDQLLRAQVLDGFVVCRGPHTFGWVKTVSKPVCYGGINPVEGETNLDRISESEIKKLTERHFTINGKVQNEKSMLLSKSQNARLDKYLIVLILILIFADSAISNRIKR